jgi:hypothetical protein
MTGRAFAACTSDTSAAALGLSTSSHCAPTVCIQVPVQLTSTPAHSQRKARCRSGAHGGASAATVTFGFATASRYGLSAWDTGSDRYIRPRRRHGSGGYIVRLSSAPA